MRRLWEVTCQSDDPDVIAYDIYAAAQDEGIEVVVDFPDEDILVVESEDAVYRVERVLDEVGEPYVQR